ncbi:MAG: hypothetical protein H0T92_17795 [Pyrinomonadaceae bacterium]|nr:hypothetical protein [Pyrinomonadaceae bacterium]
MAKKSLASITSLLLILMLATPNVWAQDRRRYGSKARAGLSAGAGAAVGAGIGALLGGKSGAAKGALLGGGGATAAWLLKNKNSRRRLGKYGQPIATIGAGTALGAGAGALFGGKKGAAVGALLGGGGTTAGYLLAQRNRREEYSPSYGNNYYGRPTYRRTTSRRYNSRRACRC